MSTFRQLCKELAPRPRKALFYFPEESTTGIAPTRLIVEKDIEICEGQLVTVNWERKKVKGKILALNGKLSSNALLALLVLRFLYYLFVFINLKLLSVYITRAN